MEYKDILLQSVDSTQTYAKEHADSFDKEKIYCIVADDQTQAKGRNNKDFICEKLNNLYITFYFQLKKDTLHITGISHILALSLVDTLLSYNINSKLKWPNDIYINSKKVSGILCELKSKNDHYDVFLGIGINVNSEDAFLKTINNATSLKKEQNKKFDRKELLEKLKANFLKNLKIFKEKGFSPFYKEYENLLLYIGEEIIFDDGKTKHVGKVHSITNEGLLNLYMKDKSIKTFAAGEIVKD